MVALSAENKIIRPLDTFRCKGKIELYGEISLLGEDGHGIVNLRRGIQRSCDVFYEVARKLGVDRLSKLQKDLV